MKTIFITAFFALCLGCAAHAVDGKSGEKSLSTQPQWLQTKVRDLNEKYEKSDKEISISKYRFKGQTFFLMPPGAPCCDYATELVDESGKTYCQLGGGFANHTDPKCADFKKTGELIETVWTRKK